MTPTNSNHKIEGRSYKEYGYGPVPVSFASTVNSSTALFKASEKSQCAFRFSSDNNNCQSYQLNMTEKGSKFLQCYAAVAGNLCLLSVGAMMGWTSPILPKLKNNPVAEDNPLGVPITEEDASWVGSLIAVGAIFGSFFAGFLAERCGRQRALLFSVVPFLIGWASVATAKSLYQIFVARFIFGFTLAIPFTALPMYVGEIAETSIRGSLGSMTQLFITIGLLYSYAIGPFVSYKILWIACTCLPIIFFFSFFTMPESPYYLLSKGRKEDAVLSLARLRGKSPAEVQKEADEIQAIIEDAYRSQTTIVDLFRVRANFKALMLTCTLVTFQQLCGINVILFYSESIFNNTGSELSPSISTIIVGVVQMFSAAITPLVVDKIGRKFLLLCSGIGATVTMGALGFFFYAKNILNANVDSISWLPVVSLVIFISLFSIGWGPIPWAMMGEMFASDIKSKASGVTVSVCWFLAFVITKFFSNVETAFGSHTGFWIFSVFSALSCVFVVLFLPETKGKSLQQIQDELNGIDARHSNFSDPNFVKT